MNIMYKILSRPAHYGLVFISILKGTFYIGYYYLTSRRIKIRFPFMVFGKLTISGPGTVEIGRKCIIVENVFRGLSITTYSKDSKIKIGQNCMLAGLTIQCKNYVELGNHVMTARSIIQDNLFIHQDEANSKQTIHEIKSQSIIVGDNVWIGGHCIVLGGTRIGADSVISAYTVCSNEIINDYSLVNGNPVRKPLPIEQLLKLRSAK